MVATALQLFERRKERVRRKLRNIEGRARLTVFRSNKYIYVQLIDDAQGKTIATASSKEKELAKLKNGANIQAAKEVGKLIATRAKAAKVTDVVFDRGGYLYHGCVKALADSARENGLKF